MSIKIRLTIDVQSDFHVGTGSGRGRATDAIVMVDENGTPFIPGSTIKGLCKWQACRLIDSFPGFGPKPEIAIQRGDRKLIGSAFEIFGGGSDARHAENRVWFDHAGAGQSIATIAVTRTGRSARDRISGRARDAHLFFYEDAGPAKFTTTLVCEDDLSPAALLLLLLSLRRITALGGQRRRGKGRCECTVKLINPGSAADLAELKGLVLPASDSKHSELFRKFAQPILAQSKTSKLGVAAREDNGASDLHETAANNESQLPQSPQTCWLVLAAAQSPLTLGYDQAVDNTISSEDFISGASLRGALAWQAIREGLAPESDLFQAAFVHERVQFGPLYPAAEGWDQLHARTMPIPVPASFCTCKQFPGAKGGKTEQVHGVADEMWRNDKVCEQVHGTTGQPDRCDYCHGATKRADGYLQLSGNPQAREIHVEHPTLDVFQRTAIDEETQRGADSQLFGLESVQRDTRLAGYIWGETNLLEQAFADWPQAGKIVRVGKAKSRGQGLVRICLRRAEAGADTCFPKLLPQPNDADDESSAEVVAPFYLTLYSDLIAVDEYLRPVSTLTAATLWKLLGKTGDPPFTLERGFVGTRRIGGFLGVVGLPRSPDIAISAGSTWRFCWLDDKIDKANPNQHKRRILKCLEIAQANGIGLRRGEGFGRVILNLPLHVAGWKDMRTVSHSVLADVTAFPEIEQGSRAKADRSRQQNQLQMHRVNDNVEYRRLFAELAQDINPLESVQAIFDDPLFRDGKSKNLKSELKKLLTPTVLAGFDLKLFDPEQNDICIAGKFANDASKVAAFRQALKNYSGEILDHV